MSIHDYFQELSALSAISQISHRENQELVKHLSECASCTKAHIEYACIVQQHLPQADTIRWRIKPALPLPSLDSELRCRFLARARAEGIDISPNAERSHIGGSIRPWWVSQFWPVTAIAAVAGLAILVSWVDKGFEQPPRSSVAMIDPRSAQAERENDSLRTQLTALRQVIEKDNERIRSIEKRNADSLESKQMLQKQLDESWQQMGEVSANLRQIEAEREELENANHVERTTIGNLRAKSDDLNRERADILGSHAILEAQVRDLAALLQEKTASLERERQLMAVSKDVRQLMGARNLHIVDVHDVSGAGNADRAFGRVFYAEGQSLIFYAFDLPNGKIGPAKYTFQAWGHREAESQSARNLGTFEVDDHEQRRWVLKITDSALLSGIDSVFVTAESLNYAKAPRGKKVLYAYISGQPNHP